MCCFDESGMKPCELQAMDCCSCDYFENDPVNHPSHYTKGKIEVADFIADQKLNFDRGNAVKYVCRAGSKDPDKEIQDLEKAIWYINHEIKAYSYRRCLRRHRKIHSVRAPQGKAH
jgi:hypothetical protein